MSARGAASWIARTASGGAISSTSPTNARIGDVMSASVTGRPAMLKPPVSIRLWTRNCCRNSLRAGPGHATQPSFIR